MSVDVDEVSLYLKDVRKSSYSIILASCYRTLFSLSLLSLNLTVFVFSLSTELSSSSNKIIKAFFNVIFRMDLILNVQNVSIKNTWVDWSVPMCDCKRVREGREGEKECVMTGETSSHLQSKILLMDSFFFFLTEWVFLNTFTAFWLD